jgi:beta-N-acetylhexosaminidase
MLAFDGFDLPASLRRRLVHAPAAGITLFRFLNVRTAAQIRALTTDLQAAAGDRLLIAADQEGGQFLALGDDATPFAGNMALGAVGDEGLAERVGRAIGLEARALGVNVVYGPCVDLATDPRNPGIGIRSFGADPAAVSHLAAAWIRGVRSAGVAATAKHFPGKGAVTQDSHHVLPVLDLSRETLAARELAPFRASIAAGADLVMSAHVAMTAYSDDPSLPATLDPAVMTGLLRDELAFGGLAISDALDMRALPQGPEQAIDAVAALRAGIDLLLLTPDEDAKARIETAVRHAAARGLLDRGALARSTDRLARLRDWLGGFEQPGLEVVGSAEHRALARELAVRSITLVRDDAGLLPLRLDPDARLLAVMPQPRDLTPADTSSRVAPQLGAALRACHARSDEFVTSHPPSDAEIAEARRRATDADVVVVGTISASFDPQQVALVEALRSTGRPLVTVALRTPFDLAAYEAAQTHIATYSILRPSLDALGAALFAANPFLGRLPA